MPGDKADEQVASGTVDQVSCLRLGKGEERAGFDMFVGYCRRRRLSKSSPLCLWATRGS